MVESLIIALREGIEIALVIGILVVYLQKIGSPFLVSSVYLGLCLAIVASIGGAMIFQKLAIDQESLEGLFQLIAAVFVISMVVWMWFTGKKIKGEIEQRVNTIVEASGQWRAHLSIISFTFFMIVREGIETAIFLQAVSLSTNAWGSLLGTLAGFSIAVVFAVLFIRGSIRIDIVRFLKVTAITLLIFALQLVVNSLHEFYEYGVFPANPHMMGILGPIVQHEVLFIIAIVCIPAVMFFIPGRSSGTGSSRPQRRWQLSAAIASLGLVLFLGVGEIFSSNTSMDFSAESVPVPSSGVVRIPITRVSDNAIHRFTIEDNGLEIRFFILRLGLGKFGTAFDACYACYSYGKYYLKNGELICSLCDAPSPLSKLRQATDEPPDDSNSGSMEGNGCAPIFLASRLHEGNIEIRVVDLQKQRKYFDVTKEQ
ncbi:MAG TPA: Fe-S-containing protein [Bacteroidota bacterium]|nr:Fe-S-containing protein [Bacteroidota bacterium]